MTRTNISAITFVLATLFAGQAMASNSDRPLTREHVKAELAQAVRSGNIVTGESSARLNEQFPQMYAQQQATSDVTRDQVKAELAEAIQTGNMVIGESGARLNEVLPNNYSTQSDVAIKSREQVKTELAESVRSGELYRHIEA